MVTDIKKEGESCNHRHPNRYRLKTSQPPVAKNTAVATRRSRRQRLEERVVPEQRVKAPPSTGCVNQLVIYWPPRLRKRVATPVCLLRLAQSRGVSPRVLRWLMGKPHCKKYSVVC